MENLNAISSFGRIIYQFLGVSLVTKANLGTSPISIPYVLSLNFSLTLGNFTIIFSLF